MVHRSQEIALRLTGKQHAMLKDHLFPGDGKEAVAIAICGRRIGDSRHCLMVNSIELIPHNECSIRTEDLLRWNTQRLVPLLQKASRQEMAILKIHSHPTGLAAFSPQDDRSDNDLFSSIFGWFDSDMPHASAIMLPDGKVFGRAFWPDTNEAPISIVSVAGDDIDFWHHSDACGNVEEEWYQANDQAFGEGTTRRLGKLSVGVVGCSGTGTPTIEMLMRLGVGKLVIVDPDVVKDRNINRMLNTTMEDAEQQKPKVKAIAGVIERTGLGTQVVPIAENIVDVDVLKVLAQCDVIFGCMDGHEGRYILNTLATYYSVPYIDTGVLLEADGHGGVDQICGSVHYLQPDGSSLLSRKVISMERVHAEALQRTNPEYYKSQVEAKYIKGVRVSRPAVVSVNMYYAAKAVNEFLARLHHYRNEDNREFAITTESLVDAYSVRYTDGEPCPLLSPYAGRGDALPFIGLSGIDRI